MGGLAALAREAGHKVTGCDSGVYPPMSDQLRALGIDLVEGYGADQLELKPDAWVVGNVVSRARQADGSPRYPLMEAILDAGLPYTSGPQWLSDHARIYKGRMPPLLYAIGVLQVEVDGRGEVKKLSWMRAPSHAPEVVKEIERTVRAASPFPVPARMGHVVYTDTWLWHKSGKFQLDTLTEGQD